MLRHRLLALAALAALAAPAAALAVVPGISGSPGAGAAATTIDLVAAPGVVSTPDGQSLPAWGYGEAARGAMQYPGPTLVVTQGQTVTVNLSNALPVPASIVFPGQADVVASGGAPGLLTREAPPGGAVAYTFVATEPGTFLYHSGTRPDLQVEMGLVGAIVVRPAGFPKRAYAHADSAFDREVLFLMTEMDPALHYEVGKGNLAVDTTRRWPTIWFLNGRAAPDTMAEPFAPWLPAQPYDCMPQVHPGERLLMRLVAAGHDPHPFHTHGNHLRVLARDGRLASSGGAAGADLAVSDFTVTVPPGGTADALWSWTGARLGWDAYGHLPGQPRAPGEYAPDHGKRFPVALPDTTSLMIGEGWSGSPFLGRRGYLPPSTVTSNSTGGYFFMWHSHTEREMTNDDVFPGGMMTMLVVQPWHVALP